MKKSRFTDSQILSICSKQKLPPPHPHNRALSRTWHKFGPGLQVAR